MGVLIGCIIIGLFAVCFIGYATYTSLSRKFTELTATVQTLSGKHEDIARKTNLIWISREVSKLEKRKKNKNFTDTPLYESKHETTGDKQAPSQSGSVVPTPSNSPTNPDNINTF